MTPEARRQIEQTIAHLQALLDADCDCPEASTTTVRELWDRYVGTLPAENWKLSVVSTMKKLIARVGDQLVAKLRPSHWEDYRDDQEIRNHYSVTTRNIQLKRAKTMLNWALDTGRIPANPWQRIRPERRKPKRQTEVSAEGEEAVLRRLDDTMQAFVVVAVDSTMRREEIRLLEWTDIDWERRRILIPAARTKTRKERIGRITSRAAEALRKIPKVEGCPFVFANPKTKQPWSQVRLWSHWREAADDAKLKPAPGDISVRYHDLRRSGARRLSRLGAPIAAIQRILGHESLATTALYVDADDRDADLAHELLEAAMRKGPQRAARSDAVRSLPVAVAGGE